MYRQSLLKTTLLLRLFYVLILLLVVMFSLSLYNSYHAWKLSREAALSTMAKQFAYQIEDYRYQANLMYKMTNQKPNKVSSTVTSPLTKIRNDVYWLSSSNQTIDAILFGSDKPQNTILASKLADYMEIVWGARNEFNSMYYLNGSDNTLILVTTHSIMRPDLRYKESYLILTAEEKRADMLTQSTLLDRREWISNLQKLTPNNIYYYTYRLMFNSPGQLTSVISFDISINSAMPFNLKGDNISISPRNSANSKEANFEMRGANLVFSQTIEGSNYQVYYRVSLKDLVIGIIGYNLALLVCMLVVILLLFFTSIFIRKRIISPNTAMQHELKFKETLNHDIINNISYGVLVYDFTNNKKLLGNAPANALLPSMDLSHIKEMATKNHDMIQVSIENNVYEIILINIDMLEDTYLFIVIDKDKEALTQRRQELVNREYNKNIQLRKVVFENMQSEIQPSLLEMSKAIDKLSNAPEEEKQTYIDQIIIQTGHINRWFNNINLLNTLESPTARLNADRISVSLLLNQFLKQNLYRLRNKGLSLYFHNNINVDSLFSLDSTHLKHLLQLIFEYSIDTTSFGKISVHLNYQADIKAIIIDIKDSGIGLTSQELNNLQHPFSGQVLNASQFTRSGIAFYLCRVISKKMNGTFTINSSPTIGSHYQITLPAKSTNITGSYPKLLEDIYIRLAIHNIDASKIVRNILSNYGAEFLNLHESSPHSDWDLLITDNNDNQFKNIIKISGTVAGINSITSRHLEVNYNFADELINAISLLIENSEAEDTNLGSIDSVSSDNQDFASISDESMVRMLHTYQNILSNSDYKDLFITTVPIDINKLYNSESVEDLTELKNTAHRLKGVFAMLDFGFLHKLCEDLELYIAEENSIKISNCIRELDISVRKLMPEGNQ
ncbi:phosphotransferase RcsD [Providencia burhodogranariea]|uniref:histidine kinase n=1 Tax=Providencia burhodogranariea DSM 19968 TaxID=1141662 RepID=K8WTL6_9GAMM|nr:phosphotransferase RcsD [Providencia burhodogranariea]EKT63903.1 phosphotransfer intermediate protein in two-component regulatory system with RcsBC [Providencia burhodogranariea DSM 19968]